MKYILILIVLIFSSCVYSDNDRLKTALVEVGKYETFGTGKRTCWGIGTCDNKWDWEIFLEPTFYTETYNDDDSGKKITSGTWYQRDNKLCLYILFITLNSIKV